MGSRTGMVMGEDFFLSLSWRSMWNSRGLGELSTLLLIFMLLGVPGSAIVNNRVHALKVLGVPIVVRVWRTAAMLVKLQS